MVPSQSPPLSTLRYHLSLSLGATVECRGGLGQGAVLRGIVAPFGPERGLRPGLFAASEVDTAGTLVPARRHRVPLPSERGTCKAVRTRFWSWRSVASSSCLFARQRTVGNRGEPWSQFGRWSRHGAQHIFSSPSSFLSSLELSDTKVYAPYIRARLSTHHLA